jgi:hypothetical protein
VSLAELVIKLTSLSAFTVSVSLLTISPLYQQIDHGRSAL